MVGSRGGGHPPPRLHQRHGDPTTFGTCLKASAGSPRWKPMGSGIIKRQPDPRLGIKIRHNLHAPLRLCRHARMFPPVRACAPAQSTSPRRPAVRSGSWPAIAHGRYPLEAGLFELQRETQSTMQLWRRIHTATLPAIYRRDWTSADAIIEGRHLQNQTTAEVNRLIRPVFATTLPLRWNPPNLALNSHH